METSSSINQDAESTEQERSRTSSFREARRTHDEDAAGSRSDLETPRNCISTAENISPTVETKNETAHQSDIASGASVFDPNGNIVRINAKNTVGNVSPAEITSPVAKEPALAAARCTKNETDHQSGSVVMDPNGNPVRINAKNTVGNISPQPNAAPSNGRPEPDEEQCESGAQATNQQVMQDRSVSSSEEDVAQPSEYLAEAQVVPIDSAATVSVYTAKAVSAQSIMVDRRCLFLLLAIVVAAAVVGGVCGSGRCGGEDPPERPQTSPPSPAPTIDPQRAVAIVEYINSVTYSETPLKYPVLEERMKTSEEEAVQWLIENDPLQLSAANPEDLARLTQRYALATFWYSTTGAYWTNLVWLSSEHECNWPGLACVENEFAEIIGESIISMNLVPSNLEEIISLEGTIPADIALLSSLEEIVWDYNYSLSGILPHSIGEFRLLRTFSAASTGLLGTLPSSIGEWTSIETFYIAPALFSGPIPESIKAWTALKSFDVGGNSFSGQLPEFLGPNLTSFSIRGNDFTGSLPESLSKCKNMESFDVSSNGLVGTLPPSFSRWTGLIYFGGTANDFTGSIPKSFGQWILLQSFALQANNLSGSLPSSIGQWTDLSDFYIGPGTFSGSLPASIGNWSQLEFFHATDCDLSGSLPSEIGNWRNVGEFIVSGNQMTGTLPEDITAWRNLYILDVSFNEFNGTIPSIPESVISEVRVQGNAFTGAVPELLCNVINQSQAWASADCVSEIESYCCSECC